jgi:hypothetical protein
MHAVLGVVSSLSGIDLLALARWIPLAFAALAIVGMYVLARRLGGVAAGLGAAFLTAMMPEHIFRTELLFPTALDLAILPAWLLVFHEATRPGPASRAWLPRERVPIAILFLALSVPLAWMHPWVVPLFGVPCLVYAAVRALRVGRGFGVTLRRLALPSILVSFATAFAMASRWDSTDTGFAGFASKLGPLHGLAGLAYPAPIEFAILFPMLLVACAAGAVVVATLASVRLPKLVGKGVACVLALVALYVVWTWPIDHGLPADVDYSHMLGLLAIFLGFAGIALAFLRPTPLGDLGLSLGAVLAPLTAINLFHSTFWPQRSVVYMAVAVALLGGSALGSLATLAVRPIRAPRLRRAAVPLAAVASLLLVAGASAAMPEKQYTWYRLYQDNEYAAFQRSADIIAERPETKVFIETWQPGLFMKAAGVPGSVWQDPAFFQDAGVRRSEMGMAHGPVYVVVEKYTQREANQGRADLSFLSGAKVVVESGSYKMYQLR